MKKIAILSAAALLAGFALTGCNNAAAPAASAAKADTTAVAGSIVFFNIDKVIKNYDMANDESSKVETKVSGIQAEIDRRSSQLQKEFNKIQQDGSEFENKVKKGLLTTSVANEQYQKIQQRQVEFQQKQYEFQQFVESKQREMDDEQQVMLNNIMNAISEFVKAYNAEKQYALILSTQGDLISLPVVTGSAILDITDEIIAGLNDEYVKAKMAETK